MSNEKLREIRVSPSDKAYIRSGKWADKNWRVINMELGLDTNTQEVLELLAGKAEEDYCRRALFTFDLTPLRDFSYRRVVIDPCYIKVNDRHEMCAFLNRTTSDWKGDEVTWNTAPKMGEIICGNTPIGCLSVLDVTDEVTRLLKAGENTLSFFMSVTEHYGRQTALNPKNAYLIASADGNVACYSRLLCEDEKKNKAIWDRAEVLFNEWYERYEKLLKTGLAKVEKIESDSSHFSKSVYTARSGFAPKDGWTPELARQYALPTRTYATMDDLGKYTDYSREQKFDEYGGLDDINLREEATGFFYSKKIDDRWWIIDPLGNRCFMRNVSSVDLNYLGSKNQTNAAIVRYGSVDEWRRQTAHLLKNVWGFNMCGSFADSTPDRSVVQASCPNLAGGYGRSLGANISNGGSTLFSENNTMNVFDPEFVTFCEKTTEVLIKNRDNPWLLGYTTDNELTMDVNMLSNYLSLNRNKEINFHSYAAAWTWLCRMTGKEQPQKEDITPELQELFRGFVWDRYYSVTSKAIRRNDPNHMILGTRFLTHVKNAEWVLRFASLHLDCITINWYGQWEADADDLKRLCELADLPIQVTEFYTKAMDSGLANTRGAGWLVPTQQDRADFYQNFTLRLLECKNMVGWHWHQYIDDDPSPEVIYKPGTNIWKDQSNIDANKGIVDNGHRPYTELVNAMAEINLNVYRLIEHFDAKYSK